jgi:thiol-disulfide isomerase/thioredoxin
VVSQTQKHKGREISQGTEFIVSLSLAKSDNATATNVTHASPCIHASRSIVCVFLYGSFFSFPTPYHDYRCGPCQMIAPKFEALSKTHTDVEFVKVDVDDADDIAAMCGVQAMPTFQFFKGGKKVDEMKGANVNGLIATIGKHK